MRHLVIFDSLETDSDGLNSLSPMADLRSGFDVRLGAFTNLQRLNRMLNPGRLTIVPRKQMHVLCATTHADFTVASVDQVSDDSAVMVNGCCVLPPAGLENLQDGDVMIDSSTRTVIAAAGGPKVLSDVCSGRWQGHRVVEQNHPGLLSRPWDLRRLLPICLNSDLSILGAEPRFVAPLGKESAWQFGPGKVFVDPSAKIHPGVTFDCEHGDIAIDADAIVRPGAIICGPVYLGPHSVVLDQCVLRGPVAIGPYSKVAGELGGVVFQGFANKAHYGYLGDSWVGEWANFGAGSTNSNLLNTYGVVPVKPRPAGDSIPSGEQFLGSIVGDHSKFAICSRLMTGLIVHTGCMYAASPAAKGCLDPFSWVTDAGRNRYDVEKFIAVAHQVAARRSIVLSQPYLDRVEELHRQTAVGR